MAKDLGFIVGKSMVIGGIVTGVAFVLALAFGLVPEEFLNEKM